MTPIQQFYEMIARRFGELETLKAAAKERGEIIVNITAAFVAGEITQQDYDDLIARASRAAESE